MSHLMQEIKQAEREILMQAYYPTSPEVITALAEKQKPAVAVEVVLDNSQLGQDENRKAALVHRQHTERV